MQARFKSDFQFVGAAALVYGFLLFLIWEGGVNDKQDRATGKMLAEIAARASIDGLVDQDGLELRVIADRLAGVPRVSSVAIFNVEDELLAIGRPREGGTGEGDTQFTHQIVHNGTLLGIARISLAAPTAALYWMRVGLSLAALLGVALLAAFWRHRLRAPSALFRGEPATAPPPEPDAATDRSPGVGDSPVVAADIPLAPEAAIHRLLVVNLHNQRALSQAERQRLADRGLAIAEQVDDIYLGKSEHLPGIGLLMAFSAVPGDDRAFQAVCAAFLLAKCLARDASPGDYRFGLHTLEQQPSQPLADYEAAVQDAGLLSALGGSGAIVASEPFFAELAERSGLDAELFSHPMLPDLTTSGSQCRLITRLDPEHQTLIELQASRVSV